MPWQPQKWGQEEHSEDLFYLPFFGPPHSHSCLRPQWAAKLHTPALDFVWNGVMALGHGVWVLGSWLKPVTLFSTYPSFSHWAA